MNRWQLKNLNDYSKREGAFIQTLQGLKPEQIDALGLRKIHSQITNSKVGGIIKLQDSNVAFNQLEDGGLEIMVSGYIYEFTLSTIQAKIEEYRTENGESPKSLLVRINSPGGSAFTGMAIYNYLSTYKGKVTTVIDGLAASAAASIFMAGSERLIHNNMITFMIHRAMSYIDILEFGNSTYLQTVDVQREKDQVLQLLGVLDNDLIDMYVDNTELKKKQVVDYMDKEYFFNKEEMQKFGIATGIYENGEKKEEENKTEDKTENKVETKNQSQQVNSDKDGSNKVTRPNGDIPSNIHSDLIADCLLFVQ